MSSSRSPPYQRQQQQKADPCEEVWETRAETLSREFPKDKFCARSQELLKECLDLTDEGIRSQLRRQEKADRKKQQDLEARMHEISSRLKDIQILYEGAITRGKVDAEAEKGYLEMVHNLQMLYDELKEISRSIHRKRADRKCLIDELDSKKADTILSESEKKKQILRNEKSKILSEKVAIQRRNRKLQDELTREKENTQWAQEQYVLHHPQRKLIPLPPKGTPRNLNGDSMKFTPRPPDTSRSAPELGTPSRLLSTTQTTAETMGRNRISFDMSSTFELTQTRRDPQVTILQELRPSTSDRMSLSSKDTSRKQDVPTEPSSPTERRRMRTISNYLGKKATKADPHIVEDKLQLPALELKLNDKEVQEKIQKQENAQRQHALRSARRLKYEQQIWLMYQAAVSRKKQAQEVLESDPTIDVLLSDGQVLKYVPDELI